MNIKKVFIILICVFASIGCTIQNISDSDIDKNLDVILNKNIKNSNKEAIGYQYYLPSYLLEMLKILIKNYIQMVIHITYMLI